MASKTIVLKLSRPMRLRLEGLSANTSHIGIFRRCQMILKLSRGEPPTQVAEALSCDVSTVYRLQQAERCGPAKVRVDRQK